MMDDNLNAPLLNLGKALKARNYRHTAITPATHARVNARASSQWATDLAGVFGWSRPFKPAVLSDGIFDLMQVAGIAEQFEGGWRSQLRASTLGDNLYFHSAWPTDATDAVFFGPDTYRYVAAILQHFYQNTQSVRRIADIGCGAGPGAIELALKFPHAKVMAVDINDAALKLSRVNALLAGASIETIKSDLLSDVGENFDLIVANPPYMRDLAERAYRNGGGPLGADLSLRIIDTALERLNPGGTLLLYTGSAIMNGTDLFRLEAEKRLRGKSMWTYREIDPDVFGEELATTAYDSIDRIAAVLLTCSCRA